MIFLVDFPSWGIALIVIAALVIVVALCLHFLPSFKQKREMKDEATYAKENVDSYVVSPKVKLPKDDDIKAYLEKKEKELNIIFTDIDIESLIVQVKQDFKDSR